MKYIKILFLFFLIVILFNSCATLINGTTQDVKIETDPSGTEVHLNGKYLGTTPCIINVKRRQKKSEYNQNNQLHYVFKKDGYEEKHIEINRSFAMSSYIDFFLNAPIGLMFVSVAVAPDPTFDAASRGVGIAIALPLLASVPIDLITGSAYTYDDIIFTRLQLDLSKKIDNNIEATVKNNNASIQDNILADYNFQKNSDVDVNIPKCSSIYLYRFALIIGNEFNN